MIIVNDNKELFRAFFIAPIIPIGILTIIYLPVGFMFLIIGLPVAYIGAILIGIPVFLLMKRTKYWGWPYFVLGGTLCALPGILIFTKYNAPIVYSLQSYVTFSALGALGGLVFWWLYPRKVHADIKDYNSNSYGYVALSIAVLFLIYIYYIGEVQFKTAHIVSSNHPFVSKTDTEIPLDIEGKQVTAILPSGMPFRKNCEVGVAMWREIFTNNIVYSINYYPDTPNAHHYQWMTKDAKEKVSKECK